MMHVIKLEKVAVKMIEIISTELIKPSSPTPQSLNRLYFSMLDQLSPSNYVPMAFYYPPPTPNIMSVQLLKTSLSETLTKYYPLAGRINGNSWIDCNDQGALFLVAESSSPLSSLLVKGSESESARQILPIGLETNEAYKGCPLFIQVTSFPCGSMGIGVRVCHKICDASSRTAFINAWAAVSRSDSHVTAPEFVSRKLFPSPPPSPSPDDDHKLPAITSPSPALELKRDQHLITNKYVFNALSVSALKAKAASEKVLNPSRVEAVTALLWKCAIKAAASRKWRYSVMTQAVNLRNRLDPPLPDSCIGNIILCYAPCYENTNINEVPDLQEWVVILRQGLSQLCDKYIKRLKQGGDEANGAIAESFREIEEMTAAERTEVYRFTSWCGFPIYGADFGSGSPACVGIATSPFKNVGVLMDTKDGCGIEAWLCLSAQDMESFDNDAELRTYVCSS